MILDLLILAAFVAWSVSTGFSYRRKASRGLEDYFLAGRTLRGWQAGLSMAATQYAADTPLLVTGLVAAAGIFAVWRLWVYGIAFLVLAFLLAPSWRKAGVITDAELTELRYGGKASRWLRALKAVYLGTLVNCTVLAMVLTAAATALVAAPVLLFAFPGLKDGERMLWVTGLSGAVLLLVTFLTPPERMDTLIRFYKRVRPPGFWGPVAKAAGEDPAAPGRALLRSLLAVLLSSATLFSLLAGGGILLVQAPKGKELLLPLGLLAAGLALVPFWWKLGMGPDAKTP